MSSLKNTRDNIVSTVTTPISTMGKAWKRRKQRTDQRRNDKQAFKAAEICLTLGRSFRQQNDLLAARDIYKQGLSALAADDIRRTQLQKEIYAVTATICVYNRQLYTVPNEIWERIFQKLTTYRDLRQCAIALTTWYNIIIHMHEFWNPPWYTSTWGWISKTITSEASMLQIGCAETNPLSSEDEWWLKELFKALSRWSTNNFQTLVFRNMYISTPLAYCVAQMLQSISPPFQQIEFGSNTKMEVPGVKYILDACSRTERISFSSNLKYCDETVSMRGNELSSVTHLEWTFDSDDGLHFLLGAIRRFPNLVLLAMDDDNVYKYTAYYRRCIEQVFEHCPRLKILNVGTRLKHSKEKMIGSGDKCSSLDTVKSYKPSPLEGIHTLKYIYWWTCDDFRFIMNKSYKTLESLYLCYRNYRDKHTNLRPLRAAYGAPNLQRVTFRLWSNDYTEPHVSTMKDMIDFFSTTFSLEEIVIDFGWHNSDDYKIPKVDDVLRTICGSCRLLRRLAIIGNIRFTASTLSEFAASAAPSLTHLEIPMDHQPRAIELVQKLSTLVYFRLSNICYNRYDGNDLSGYSRQAWSCVDTIERITKDRRASAM